MIMDRYIDYAEDLINKPSFKNRPVIQQNIIAGLLVAALVLIPTIAIVAGFFILVFILVGFFTGYWWLSILPFIFLIVLGIYYLGKYTLKD